MTKDLGCVNRPNNLVMHNSDSRVYGAVIASWSANATAVAQSAEVEPGPAFETEE